MTAPFYHRRDPQPLGQGWELAVVVIGGTLLAAAAAALTGLGLSSLLFGGGWVWPHGTPAAEHVLGGLLGGDPGRGLPARQARRVPAPVAVYSFVTASEIILVAVAVAAGVLIARFRRPGDTRGGMASHGDAARVLGIGRLRTAKTIIRPDRGRFQANEVGWRLGRSQTPPGVELWCRYDRTCGVYGAQGSGKTLDLLSPALLAHAGPALVTLTKVEDLLLTAARRHEPAPGPSASRRGKQAAATESEIEKRPIVVLDPFGLAPGQPALVWDPVAGCADPLTAERRAKAFAAGTVTGAVAGGRTDNAARFYAAETAKVLAGFFHAAALTGRTIEHVMDWVAHPVAAEQPVEILRQHPHAARFWDGLLAGALQGSSDTVANTVTTVQQALGLFFQPAIRARCVPAVGRRPTDLAALIRKAGTVYLVGREDPYASASPLLTAVAEQVLDTALAVAAGSPYARACPPFLAVLDELPSTAPLPTLRTRMANDRALGISYVYAAQTWRQLVVCYGEDEARSLLGLTNVLVLFGGGKDIGFYREMSELLGATRVTRRTLSDGPAGVGTSRTGEDTPILRPEQLRLIPDRQAVVVAENAPPIIARLRRCLDGRAGRKLAGELADARAALSTARAAGPDVAARTAAAVAYARDHRLHPCADDGAASDAGIEATQ